MRAPNGRPLAEANVFLLETLDGVLTGDDGRFRVPVRDFGTVTLVIRKVGFLPQQRAIPAGIRDSITVVLEVAPNTLDRVTVQAGRYSADNGHGATLSSLEVATTPGAANDVNRAIQSLPGVQQVNEGTALYVRGGDYTETKVFLNEASVLNPAAVQPPDGTFMGTVDPFLLDGIVFSSGGFGARYGNALSGVVDLHTQGPPLKDALSVSAGLAAISASVARPLSHALAMRGAANLFDLQPMIALNGSAQHYTRPPRGHDVSGSLTWSSEGAHPRAGALSVFGIDQTSELGVTQVDPSYNGDYRSHDHSDLFTLNWRTVLGSFAPVVTFSSARLAREERFGALAMTTDLRDVQLFTQGAWTASDGNTLRAGAELDRLRSELAGAVPSNSADLGPGARVRSVVAPGLGVRRAAFVEADLQFGGRIRTLLGARTDASSLTAHRTVDSRVSASYAAGPILFTTAWGIYHEVPDPMLFESTLGEFPLRSMRARHTIAGIQIGEGRRVVRMELYDKRYADLSQRTRDYRTSSGGRGMAHGMDIFARVNTPLGTAARVTYSFLASRRTDPNSGEVADAPFDVPHSVVVVVERSFAAGWLVGGAWRYATGRPTTPVVGAVWDTTQARWLPLYGAPYSVRLPVFTRADVSVSQVRQLSPEWRSVVYASINNVFARRNVYDYTYSADYTERRPIRSLFTRSLYFGATLTH